MKRDPTLKDLKHCKQKSTYCKHRLPTSSSGTHDTSNPLWSFPEELHVYSAPDVPPIWHKDPDLGNRPADDDLSRTKRIITVTPSFEEGQ